MRMDGAGRHDRELMVLKPTFRSSRWDADGAADQELGANESGSGRRCGSHLDKQIENDGIDFFAELSGYSNEYMATVYSYASGEATFWLSGLELGVEASGCSSCRKPL
eukprot:4036214-Pyramimonas_sp.AAC.1